MTTPQEKPRPLRIAELARHLRVDPSTVRRALRNDPSAPPPVDTDDLDRSLYDEEAVTRWWPHRRRRGKPAAAQPVSLEKTAP